jgi:hypothetical protein
MTPPAEAPVVLVGGGGGCAVTEVTGSRAGATVRRGARPRWSGRTGWCSPPAGRRPTSSPSSAASASLLPRTAVAAR